MAEADGEPGPGADGVGEDGVAIVEQPAMTATSPRTSNGRVPRRAGVRGRSPAVVMAACSQTSRARRDPCYMASNVSTTSIIAPPASTGQPFDRATAASIVSALMIE